jgi:hypothetical protein
VQPLRKRRPARKKMHKAKPETGERGQETRDGKGVERLDPKPLNVRTTGL